VLMEPKAEPEAPAMRSQVQGESRAELKQGQAVGEPRAEPEVLAVGPSSTLTKTCRIFSSVFGMSDKRSRQGFLDSGLPPVDAGLLKNTPPETIYNSDVSKSIFQSLMVAL
jgi:hypothetical protein